MGTDHEKAEVFLRIVQPEMTKRVLVQDKDIRMAVFFLTNASTILLYMTSKEVRAENGLDDASNRFLKTKMSEYEVVYQSIIDNFTLDMFGEFSNSVSREDFRESLATDGWKYFDRKNLNELFSIKYQVALENGTMPQKP